MIACIRSGIKIKDITELENHLYEKHRISLINPDEIKEKTNYPYIDIGKIIDNSTDP